MTEEKAFNAVREIIQINALNLLLRDKTDEELEKFFIDLEKYVIDSTKYNFSEFCEESKDENKEKMLLYQVSVMEMIVKLTIIGFKASFMETIEEYRKNK